MRVAAGIYRIVGAAAIMAAVIAQGFTTVTFFAENGKGDDPGFYGFINFLSMFTIDSNVFAAVTLVIGAVILFRFKGDDAYWFAVLRTCAVAYMTVTGLVYNLLLRSIELPQGRTLEWANEVLHLIGPAILLLDWVFAPGRVRVGYKKVAVVAIFPIVWLTYTLLRGPFAIDPSFGTAPFYPYPFLNPSTSESGYLSVAIYVVVIALIICAVAAGLIWISRRLGRTVPSGSGNLTQKDPDNDRVAKN
ncbi:Pr6Pr family membrane protein [Arthrobacter sp. TMN-49]